MYSKYLVIKPIDVAGVDYSSCLQWCEINLEDYNETIADAFQVQGKPRVSDALWWWLNDREGVSELVKV